MQRTRLLLIAIGAVLLASSAAFAAAPPGVMSYQGVLRSGTTPLDGPQDMVFRFFADEAGGDALLVDSHTSAQGGQVTASAGTFQVLLGAGVVTDGPAPGTFTGLADVFAAHGDVYLETEVGGETLAPRVRIASSAYALNAHALDGLGAAAFVPATSNASLAFKALRQGATLVFEGAATVRVKPGVLGFPDAKLRESTADLLWSFANGVGPLGLDAGVEATDTWYYLYAIPDPGNDDMFTVVASVEAPAQAGGTGPGGHPVHRFIGSIRNNGAGDIFSFNRLGDTVRFLGDVGSWRVFTGSESPLNTWVPVDAAGFQPVTSRSIVTSFWYDGFGASTSLVYWVVAGASAAPAQFQLLCSDWGDGADTGEQVIPTLGRQFSWRAGLHTWSNNGAGQHREFSYVGYGENLQEY